MFSLKCFDVQKPYVPTSNAYNELSCFAPASVPLARAHSSCCYGMAHVPDATKMSKRFGLNHRTLKILMQNFCTSILHNYVQTRLHSWYSRSFYWPDGTNYGIIEYELKTGYSYDDLIGRQSWQCKGPVVCGARYGTGRGLRCRVSCDSRRTRYDPQSLVSATVGRSRSGARASIPNSSYIP